MPQLSLTRNVSRMHTAAPRSSTACKGFRTLPLHRPTLARRPALQVRAEFQSPKSTGSKGIVEAVDTVFKRYDFVSTGMGALMVTGYCWSRGQDPITALTITFTSTVVALVVNELFFGGSNNCQQ